MSTTSCFVLVLLLFSVLIEFFLVVPDTSSAAVRLRSRLNTYKNLSNEQAVDSLLDLLELTKTFCPVELLSRGVLAKHPAAQCLGFVCGVCTSGTHFRKQCPSRIDIHGLCVYCYLPKSLCGKPLHDPDHEFAKLACPWRDITLTVMKLAMAGDQDIHTALGDLRPSPNETREKTILLKLWKIPATGSLLPLGVTLLVQLARRCKLE